MSQQNGWFVAYVEGIALWAPFLEGWESARAIILGESVNSGATISRPVTDILPPNERRRAPDTVAVTLEVASKACAHAARDPATLATVFASTHGDLAITDYMCETLAVSPSMISPTKFHNSTHNAAAGYWSIATKCMAPYTALSGYLSTFAQGMIEALTQVECNSHAVLYVFYDIEAHGPLATIVNSKGILGGALVISPYKTDKTRTILRWHLHEDQEPKNTNSISECASLVAANAMFSCFPLFEALAGIRKCLNYVAGPQLTLDIEIVQPD